jgi:hypothetical protein
MTAVVALTGGFATMLDAPFVLVLLAAKGARCRRSRVPMARQGDGDAHADCNGTRD